MAANLLPSWVKSARSPQQVRCVPSTRPWGGHRRMRRTVRLLWSVIGIVGLTATTVATFPARASDPPSDSLVVPGTPGQSVQVTWHGTIPPGTNPTSDCNGGTSPTDDHDTTIQVPIGLYQFVTADFTFAITWTPASPDPQTSDEILTVTDPNGVEIGTSDGSDTTEQVGGTNLAAGTYKVSACGFANALPQDYTG